MKRFIKWRCAPTSYGYHLVATTDIGGKSTEVNMVLTTQDWNLSVNKAVMFENVVFQMNRAFDVITAKITHRPPLTTLH